MSPSSEPASRLGSAPVCDRAIREQVERILAGPEFKSNERGAAFLRYVVDETLAGRGKQLKGYAIALAVLGRDESFDPQNDPVVRLEARRLRRDLEHYYLSAGRHDPIRIEIPKGAYVPVFEQVAGDHLLDDKPAVISQADGKLAPGEDGAHISPTRRRPLALLALAILAVALTSVGTWWFKFNSGPSEAAMGPPSIAVLPLTSFDEDPAQDYFAQGVTAELIGALTKFDHMVVVSRAVSLRHQGTDADLRTVGRDLGATHLLTGNVRRGSDRVRVGVELHDARNAKLVWSNRFDRELSTADLIDLQESIASEVARAIASPYGAVQGQRVARAASEKPGSLTSYDCVLRLHAYWTRRSAEQHRQMRDCFERAVAAEPDYAMAWAGLAYAYLDEVREGFNPRPDEPDPLGRALQAARRAVALAPDSAKAHEALYATHFIRNEVPQFVEVGERALALNPNDVDILADYGFKLAVSGHWERGLALLEGAIAQSPVHPTWWHFAIALNQYRQADYEASLRESLVIDMPRFHMTHVFRAMNYGQLGRIDEAGRAVREIVALKPDYGSEVRQDFRRRNVPEPLIEHIVEGLRKAGLEQAPST